jgi:hypothetical protein
MRRKVMQRQADKADELRLSRNLDRPESVTARVKSRLNAISKSIGFSAIERAWKMLHHHRVGIELGEGLSVAGPPTPQQETLRTQVCVAISN